MSLLALAAVLSTMHYEGDVVADGGDYVNVPIEVPAGAVECDIAHTDGSDFVILDWGVWAPDGSFRGWGGGNTEDAIIGVDQSSRSYLPGPIAAGTWTVVIGKAKLGANGGHYSIDVTCSDTATLPVLPELSSGVWSVGETAMVRVSTLLNCGPALSEKLTTRVALLGVTFVSV